MSGARAPAGLGQVGKKLWTSVTAEFDLTDVELIHLEQACRVRDRVRQLQDVVESDGIMLGSSQGSRLHPAIAETRQQQLTLAKLLATLAVPAPEEDGLPVSSGVRGTYKLRSVG